MLTTKENDYSYRYVVTLKEKDYTGLQYFTQSLRRKDNIGSIISTTPRYPGDRHSTTTTFSS
jgi:hypothetical protein